MHKAWKLQGRSWINNIDFLIGTYDNVSNLFIVSLAVADVIVGIIVMPMSAAYIFTERWMLGVAFCQIWIGVDYTASTASILNLFILSLDRYWSVRQPLKYLHKRTKRRALSMIGVVWVVSSLWIIPIASWHYFAHGGVRTVPHDECDTEYAKNSLFKVITAFFNFYLPLSVMFILYFRIFIAIRKRSKFEMGHRYPGGTVISFKTTNNVTTLHSLEDSDYMNDEVEGRQNHNSFYHSHPHQAEELHGRAGSRQNGTRNTVPNGCRHLRLMAASCSIRGRGAGESVGRGRGRASDSSREMRGGGSRGRPGVKRRDFTPTSSSRFKVEYIYDENVMDPQTEKIERYFYEDSYPLSRMNRARWASTNTNSDNRISGGKTSTMSNMSTCSSSSSPSTFPSAQRAVRFRSSLHPVNEGKTSNRLSAPSTPYQSGYSEVPLALEYHQQHLKSQKSQQQKQQDPPHEHFMTVGGKTTAVVKRSLFKRQKHLDDDEFKVCLRDGGKTAAGKDNDKPRSRLKLDTFRRNKPAVETPFSSKLGVHGSSSLSSSSASTFGDSGEGKWVLSSFSLNTRCDSKSRRGAERERVGVTSSGSVSGGVSGLKERLKTMRQSSSLNKEIKAARQLGVIMGAFTLCFLPYFILFMVVAFCDDCVRPGHLTTATWVGYLNSTLNPFLYPLCNANFRIKFRSMLSCSGSGRNGSGRLGARRRNHDFARASVYHSRYD
ncbi:hypothetical protein EGW08_022713 [Elysia chlorotica]|uniref:G-protein coupled receptors family 1 profile domain-containing protein n=1 Tax=Elysia chlorotica TaxID=188477 RepID=A0A3S0ZKH8_ELYCH|nr:hypothetical protein EGW08_022713 [Elysia chlorotica]